MRGPEAEQSLERVCGMTLQDLQDDFLTIAHYHRLQHAQAGGGGMSHAAGMWHAGIPALAGSPGLSAWLARMAQQSGKRAADLQLVWRVMEARPDWAQVVRECARGLWGTPAVRGGQVRPEEQQRAKRPPKELSWHVDMLDTPPTVA